MFCRNLHFDCEAKASSALAATVSTSWWFVVCGELFLQWEEPSWSSDTGSHCCGCWRGTRGVEGRWREQKASFFAGGEELQGFLEVLDGRAHIFVLQGAAGVLTELLSLTEVLQGEMDATWRGSEREEERSVMEVEIQKVWRQKRYQSLNEPAELDKISFDIKIWPPALKISCLLVWGRGFASLYFYFMEKMFCGFLAFPMFCGEQKKS